MTEKIQLPRVMFAAPQSGSGKTMITCGVLAALKKRGLRPVSFKCGPDYIDPLFHGKVTGVTARNLDPFFMGEDTRRRFAQEAAKGGYDLSVMEGVMGFYDGIGGTCAEASSYDLAKQTDTPVILIVDARGMSLSLIPMIQGFLDYPKKAGIGPNVIAGVILNRVSASACRFLQPEIEKQTGIRVYGYLPECAEARIESRHLGLFLPDEIGDFAERIRSLAGRISECLDLDGILSLAAQARDYTKEDLQKEEPRGGDGGRRFREEPVRIGVAKDEAFCFYYQDNLDLLGDLGASVTFFSPLHDEKLPEKTDALILGGGYPELCARELSENRSMRRSIRAVADGGMPYLAECGGFLYLHETLEDPDGRAWPMCGVYPAKAFCAGKLGSFGYVTVCGSRPQDLLAKGEQVRGHEYHYYESTDPGEGCTAVKPGSTRQWPCMHVTDHSAAGFAHLYYRSDAKMILRFLNCARKYRTRRKGERP